MTVMTTAPAVPRAPFAHRWMLTIVLGGQAMASMDGSIVNVALPSIRATLAASGAQLQLVAAAYLLSFAAFVVTAARLGDRYGHSRVFRLGLIGFTIASLGCGLCTDPMALIVVRLLQGTAAAAMIAQVVALIQLGFEGTARVRAISWYSLVLALGVAAGQVAGGALVAVDVGGLGWRAVFLVNVPIGLVLAVLARRLPSTPTTSSGRLDLIGAALLAISVSAVVGALSIGRQQRWPLWSVTTLLAGLVGLVAFAAYEQQLSRAADRAPRARQPLLDLRVLQAPGVGTGLAASFLVMGAYSGFLFTLTLYLQNSLGFGALRSGLTFVPFAAGFATTSLGWRRLPSAAGRWMPIVGPFVFAAGISAVAASSMRHWPTAAAGILLALAGAGHAASFSPLFARITALTPTRYASSLSAAANTGTLLTSAITIAALGGLYLSTVHHGSGLIPVVVAADAILILTAACAAWTVTPHAAG
jgi:predicted MFS family arabinose efflux permease